MEGSPSPIRSAGGAPVGQTGSGGDLWAKWVLWGMGESETPVTPNQTPNKEKENQGSGWGECAEADPAGRQEWPPAFLAFGTYRSTCWWRREARRCHQLGGQDLLSVLASQFLRNIFIKGYINIVQEVQKGPRVRSKCPFHP